jgi:hypothetical protein
MMLKYSLNFSRRFSDEVAIDYRLIFGFNANGLSSSFRFYVSVLVPLFARLRSQLSCRSQSSQRAYAYEVVACHRQH